MLGKDEDTFFKDLADKISRVEVREPSNADWESFSKAYDASKGKHKRRGLIWFPLLLLIATSFVAYLYLPTSNERPVVQKDNGTSINNEKQLKEVVKMNLVRTKSPFKNNANMPANTVIEEQRNISKETKMKPTASGINKAENGSKNEVFLSEPNAVLGETSQNIVLSLEEETNFVEETNYMAPNVFLPLNSRCPKLLDYNKEWKLDLKALSQMPLQNTKVEKEAKTPMRVPIISFVGSGLVYQSNFLKQQSSAFLNGFFGLGLEAERKLINKWSIKIGVNGMYNEFSTVSRQQYQTSEWKIESIDTTIKYNSLYGRLMMHIDTVSKEIMVDKEEKVTANSQNYLVALPIQVLYTQGNNRLGMFASTGLNTLILTSKNSVLRQINGINETNIESRSNEIYLAPMFGLGGYRGLGDHFRLQGSFNYQRIIGSQKPNNLFLNMGIQYKF